MKLVRATNASAAMNKKLKEFHRIVREGEEFVVSDERYAYLNGGNPFRAVFVKLIKEVDDNAPVVANVAPVVETTTTVKEAATEEEPEVVVIKPKKTSTKKKTAVE